MKLGITGEGGVGKTTASTLLAKALSDTGRQVVAIDADPNTNLISCFLAIGRPGRSARLWRWAT